MKCDHTHKIMDHQDRHMHLRSTSFLVPFDLGKSRVEVGVAGL